jgi:GTP-binding protein
MTHTPLDHKLHEAGRQIFAQSWEFEKGIAHLDQLSGTDKPEIAFAGRSNVGKSSLINALTGQKALARTSNTPGRTQQLNLFFSAAAPLTVVDMPGYGFAKAPPNVVATWHRLIRAYLRGRPNLARVFVLVDGRHGLKSNDEEMLAHLDECAVSYQIILTKCDKLKPDALEHLLGATYEALRKRPAAFPHILATSSVSGDGLDTVRQAIARLLYERNYLVF